MTKILTYWGRSFCLLLVSASFLIGVCAVSNLTAVHGSDGLNIGGGSVDASPCKALRPGEIPGHVLVREGMNTWLAGPGMVAKTLSTNPPKTVTVYNYCR